MDPVSLSKMIEAQSISPARAPRRDVIFVNEGTASKPTSARLSGRRLLFYTLLSVVAFHALQVTGPWPHSAVLSWGLTGAVGILAAACGLWRVAHAPANERFPWAVLSASLMFLGSGVIVEALIGRWTNAVNLTINAADFFYVEAAFLLALTLSSTRRATSVRSVVVIYIAETALAGVLIYVLLYRMAWPPADQALVLSRIYAAENAMLAIMAVSRLLAWSSREELHRTRMICIVISSFFAVDTGMVFATVHWGIKGGTLLDLVWSMPFLWGSYRILTIPFEEPAEAASRMPRQVQLTVEGLYPFLVVSGVFALAASIASRHPVLMLFAIFLLLLLQNAHNGLIQAAYVSDHELLQLREAELNRTNAALAQASMEDALTGIFNRRRFDQALEDAWKRCARRNEFLALMIIDVDCFKAVNDLHGHTYGDECLKVVSKRIARFARRPADDLVARYGGDEFVFLMPNTNLWGACRVAESLRAAISDEKLFNEGSPYEQRLTVTIGVSALQPTAKSDPSVLFRRADQALYRAKQAGRNCVFPSLENSDC